MNIFLSIYSDEYFIRFNHLNFDIIFEGGMLNHGTLEETENKAEFGDPKKAMYIYRSAYNMREVKGLTKEYLLELAERIKEDFNY